MLPLKTSAKVLSDAIVSLENDNIIDAESHLRSVLLFQSLNLNGSQKKHLVTCHQLLIKVLIIQNKYDDLGSVIGRLMLIQSEFDEFFHYMLQTISKLSLRLLVKQVCSDTFIRKYSFTDTDAFLLIDSLLIVNLIDEAIVIIDKLLLVTNLNKYALLIKKGRLHNRLHDQKLAKESFEEAVFIKPKCVAGLFNLATCLEEFGSLDNAEALYYRALELEPMNVDLISRLIYLRKQTLDNQALAETARVLLKDKNLTEIEQETLNFALGKNHDDINSFEMAFQYYTKANEVSCNRFIEYKAEYFESYSKKIIDSLCKSNYKCNVLDCEYNFIFICGMFRSGTTLLEQLIAYRDDIYTAGELTFVEELIHEIFPEFPMKDIDEKGIIKFRNAYIEKISKIENSKKIITNKMPDNFWYVGILTRAFPSAKFIFTDREKYDVCLSVYFNQLSSKLTYSNNLEATAHFYDIYKKMSIIWQVNFPNNTFSFNYDDFIENSEFTAKELHKFLKLDWSSRCLEFHTLRNNVKTASLWQVRQPLFKGSSGRYNNYIEQIKILMDQ